MRFRFFSLSVLVFLTACNNDSDVSQATFDPPVQPIVEPVVQPKFVALEDKIIEDNVTYGYLADSSLAASDVSETASLKSQEMTIKGQKVKYTARAGHLTAYAPKDPNNPDKQDAQATIFYMAYTSALAGRSRDAQF